MPELLEPQNKSGEEVVPQPAAFSFRADKGPRPPLVRAPPKLKQRIEPKSLIESILGDYKAQIHQVYGTHKDTKSQLEHLKKHEENLKSQPNTASKITNKDEFNP